jgi:hypothetical protein
VWVSHGECLGLCVVGEEALVVTVALQRHTHVPHLVVIAQGDRPTNVRL